MSLIYFDGMDQYLPVTLPTSVAKFMVAGTNVSNMTSVAADPTACFMDPTKNIFVRIYGDTDRIWRIPGTIAPGNNLGGTAIMGYAQTRLDAPYSSLSTSYGYGFMLNALKPVSTCTHITAGFKMKVAYGSGLASFPVGSGLLLAAFATDSNFTTVATTFGIVYENSKLYVRQLTGSDGITSVLSTAFPANTFVDTADGYIGTSNFVCGASSSVATTPTLDVLSPNTVEVQYTAAGKISIWINNMFAGTATFANPAPYVGTQYIKTGCLAQAASFGNGVTNYGFMGVTDVYLLDGLGSRNNNRLGKVKVVSRVPAADAGVQFVRPDTSNSNSSVASQLPPVVNPSLTGTKAGDTDLYSATAFNFTNEAILGTAVTTVGYKTDPSGNNIAPVLNVTGTNYVGNSNVLPISTTLMKTEQYVYEINPKTGQPFTKTDLDATTFGVTVVVPS